MQRCNRWHLFTSSLHLVGAWKGRGYIHFGVSRQVDTRLRTPSNLRGAANNILFVQLVYRDLALDFDLHSLLQFGIILLKSLDLCPKQLNLLVTVANLLIPLIDFLLEDLEVRGVHVLQFFLRRHILIPLS